MKKTRKIMPKGSCQTIPCGQPCSCKTICVNCCNGQEGCYNTQKFKPYETIWFKTENKNSTQLNLFTCQ